MKPRLLLAPAIAITVVMAGCSSDAKPTSTAPPGVSVPAAIDGVETFTGLTRNHVEGTVDYPQSPPVGGDHNPEWMNCGVYDEPVPNENAVHSLEHGAVWLTYEPGLAADQVAVLRAFALNQTHILVSPYPGLDHPVVATAWGVQLRLDSALDPRLAQFVAKYQEGPQTPELGITCSGAKGNPIA